MEQKMYAVLCEIIRENSDYYDFELRPISVIKGEYDETRKIFTDNSKNEFFVYDNTKIIDETNSYTVIQISSIDEIEEQFPDVTDIDELKKLFFDWVTEAEYFVIYNPETNKIDIFYEYKNANENVEEIIDLSVDILKEKQLTLLTNIDLELLISLDDFDEIRQYLTDLMEDKDEYEKSFNNSIQKVCVKDSDIKDLLNNNLKQIKYVLKNLYDNIMKNIVFNNEKNGIELYFYNFDKMYENIQNASTKELAIKHLEDMSNFCKNWLDETENNVIHSEPSCRDRYAELIRLLRVYIVSINRILKLSNLKEIKDVYHSLYAETYDLLKEAKSELCLQYEQEKQAEEEQQDQITVPAVIEKAEKSLEEIINNVEESMKKINCMIGLEKIKDQIRIFKNLKIYESITSKYIKSEKNRVNMVFYGNPGTGKTTVARLLGEIFYALGYTKTKEVTECTATDLIGEYVGHTGPKTKKLFDANRGGIIFIDEAYGLISRGNTSFSNDAIVELLKEFEKGEIIFILAGYREEMKEFIDSNPGLKNRINYYFDYENYTIEQLYEIFEQKINNMKKEDSEIGYILDDSIKNEIMSIIKENRKKQYFSNGRFIDNLVKAILLSHANRIIENKLFNKDDILTIKKEDVSEESTNNLDIKEKVITWGIH